MVLYSADRLSILDIALESGTLAGMLDVIKGKGFKKQHVKVLPRCQNQARLFKVTRQIH